ncbi:MAG: DUF3179 domain-containing protein [Proteobacteria bacterium]|nr:DUF3179 domain-containing protein [Pseudomonadota bacterium]
MFNREKKWKSAAHLGLILFVVCWQLIAPEFLHAAGANGFDLRNSDIPVNKIERGGPPRDGIPAINQPRFVTAATASEFMHADDRVIGIELNGETRAYPVKILNYHEIVNDRINGQGIFISYCPLCGTAMAFRSSVNDRDLSFGVSGLLYNSDVLMYDRQTESLWSQILGRAVSGPSRGAELQSIPVIHTSWQGWLKSHSQTRVLSTQTGYNRNYSKDPYAGYAETERLWFRVANQDKRYSKKEWVLALELDGVARAWPFSELEKAWQQDPKKIFLQDSINGQSVKVFYQPENRSAYITDDSGEPLSGVSAFWFAWMAFHPLSEVFTVCR